MAKIGQLTIRVRRGSEGSNCLVAQAAKGRVGKMDFQKHCPGVQKRRHSLQLWGEPGALQNGVGSPVMQTWGECTGLCCRQVGLATEDREGGAEDITAPKKESSPGWCGSVD